MSMDQTVREQWLELATDILRSRFPLPVPAIRVSVGFPTRTKGREKLGQCWSPEVAGDCLHHLFISPVCSDVVSVIATLTHELVHATVGLQAKHGKAFKRLAVSVGLTGKMTATAATPKLAEFARLLPFRYILVNGRHERMGEYPHPSFDPSTLTTDKQTTRLIKVTCPVDGCVVRMTRKWLEDLGPPTCHCGAMMEVAP